MKQRLTLIAASIALALPLAACNNNPNETVGQKLDRAVETTKEKTAAAGEKIEATTDKAVDATKDALAKAGDKMESAQTSDTAITASVKAGLVKDPDLSALKIDVDTSNGVVALNGVADTPAARDRAGTIAQGVAGVKEVHNNVTVKKG